jgi:hypothetical protein
MIIATVTETMFGDFNYKKLGKNDTIRDVHGVIKG